MDTPAPCARTALQTFAAHAVLLPERFRGLRLRRLHRGVLSRVSRGRYHLPHGAATATDASARAIVAKLRAPGIDPRGLQSNSRDPGTTQVALRSAIAIGAWCRSDRPFAVVGCKGGISLVGVVRGRRRSSVLGVDGLWFCAAWCLRLVCWCGCSWIGRRGFLLFFLDVRIWLSIMRTSSSAAVLECRCSGAGRGEAVGCCGSCCSVFLAGRRKKRFARCLTG